MSEKENDWSKYFRIVEENIEKVPSGKGKVKSTFYEDIIEDFLASGRRNSKREWVATKPSLSTVRGSLQKLVRGEGKKEDDTSIPAGKYYGKVEVSVITEHKAQYIYFVNVAKQKEYGDSQSVDKPKKGKK